MYALAIALFGVVLLISTMNMTQTKQAAFTDNVKADVAAANFWSYRRSVSTYVSAHSSATGTVPDTSLTFQLGYVRNTAWTNVISGGTLYTYSTVALPSGTIAAIAKRGGMTMMIGVAKNGTMSSLTNAATGYVLPAGIPTGAVVAIGN